jgi:predicted acyltransferase (DUF342 family)
LHAPKILFGVALPGVTALEEFARIPYEPARDSRLAMQPGLWRIAQSVDVPPLSVCESALVVQGHARVGAQSWLRLSLKSNGDIRLDKHCQVDDAVVAAGNIDIGPDCRIKGPIISEMRVVLRRGSTVGSPASPTTISAPHIEIEEGAVVFGSVWAREQGEVMVDKTKEKT